MKLRITPTCILFVTVCIAAGLAQQSMPGGWTKALVSRQEVVDAAAFAVEAQGKAMQAPMGGQPDRLKLIEVLGAEEQVVAGMSYRLKLKVKVNGREKQAEAAVWWQAWRKPAPYQLISWKWSDQ